MCKFTAPNQRLVASGQWQVKNQTKFRGGAQLLHSKINELQTRKT